MDIKSLKINDNRCEECSHRDVCRFSKTFKIFAADLRSMISEMPNAQEDVSGILTMAVECSKFIFDGRKRGAI